MLLNILLLGLADDSPQKRGQLEPTFRGGHYAYSEDRTNAHGKINYDRHNVKHLQYNRIDYQRIL
jgi:hypothetical protein